MYFKRWIKYNLLSKTKQSYIYTYSFVYVERITDVG